MYFDKSRNAFVDSETGAVIPIEAGDNIPEAEIHDSQFESDHELAMRLAAESGGSNYQPLPSKQHVDSHSIDIVSRDHELALKLAELPDDQYPSTNRYEDHSSSQLETDRELALTLAEVPDFPDATSRRNEYSPIDPYGLVNSGPYEGFENPRRSSNTRSAPPPAASRGWIDDFSLAKALQAMEFEIDNEIDNPDDEDFNAKEYRASSCRRQIVTISSVIVLVQVTRLFSHWIYQGFTYLFANLFGLGQTGCFANSHDTNRWVRFENR